jgi:two-component system, NtrC family, sensor kinase
VSARIQVGAPIGGAVPTRESGGVSGGVSGAASTARMALATLAGELDSMTELTRTSASRVLAVARDALGALEAEIDARTAEVREQRHFIEQVVDALPLGLYVVDRDYRVQAWNHTRETGLQGIARGEAIGRTIFEILHRQSAESLRCEFDAVFASGELRQFETETQGSAADGRAPRTFRMSKIPLRLHGADVTHVISIGEDVTASKEVEARAAHAEKLAAIGQLAAGVMHEINNPLATIAACAESMALHVESEPPAVPLAQHREYLRVIAAEVQRCKGIIDGLLNFSRARPAQRVPVDPNAIVEQTLFLLKHHTRFKHVAVRLELDRGLGPSVSGNAEQLIQVLMALLLNAVDALEERQRASNAGGAATASADAEAGAITVRTRRASGAGEGPAVVVEVVDQGVGIPRAAVRKIFEPFYTTKPPGRGTGLGLSVCYGIVADHGGRMEVDSEVGAGSTFKIILPDASAGAGVARTEERRSA